MSVVPAVKGRPLGKRPAKPGAVSLRYADYRLRPDPLWQWILELIEQIYGPIWSPTPPKPQPSPTPDPGPTPVPPPDPNALPVVPISFGMDSLPSPWGMMGNDSAGDCVEAGIIHSIMRWTLRNGGATAPFSDDDALNLYSAWTGYDPNYPSTDQGTNMVDAYKRWQKTGVTDDAGKVHKIGAYVALTAGDTDELAEAAYIFGCVGVGVQFPDQWMDAFDDGEPWDRIGRPNIEGGHYIPVIGRKPNGNFVCVTWGKLQEITPAGYKQFADEGLVAVSEDQLNAKGVNAIGFDYAKLTADLAKVKAL